MAKVAKELKARWNEVTDASLAKEQKTMSISELTEKEIEELPDKEF